MDMYEEFGEEAAAGHRREHLLMLAAAQDMGVAELIGMLTGHQQRQLLNALYHRSEKEKQQVDAPPSPLPPSTSLTAARERWRSPDTKPRRHTAPARSKGVSRPPSPSKKATVHARCAQSRSGVFPGTVPAPAAAAASSEAVEGESSDAHKRYARWRLRYGEARPDVYL